MPALHLEKPVALGADHGGYTLKEAIKAHLLAQGVAVEDFGTDSLASVDYPDYAVPACEAVVAGRCGLAILCCSTGVGISIAANKVRGIRACCCSDAYSAEYTRRHNDANVLCLGGKVIGEGVGCALADIFLSTAFEGGRHQRRVDKIMAIEAR